MTNKINLKFLTLTISIVLLVLTIFGIYFLGRLYKGIFRLSYNQITSSLVNTNPQCKKISDCKLLPGDILVRRYITEKTWLIDKLAHPYFTHSAFYMGEDQLIEAIGSEKKHIDDIQILELSKSDWFNSDVNNFIVIRPKNYSNKLDTIKNNLKNIAEDPNYIFGLPKNGYKKTDCADLIFNQLLLMNIVTTHNNPNIITPDYIFWVTKNHPNDFEIIGASISQ